MNLFNCKILLFVFIVLSGLVHSQGKAGNAIKTSKDSVLISATFDSIAPTGQKFTKPVMIRYDSSSIEVRQIDSSKIYSYLKDKDFKYFEDPEYSVTLWERISEWLQQQFAKLFSFDPKGITGDVINYLLMAFAFLAIIYVIYRKEIKGLFSKSGEFNSIKSSEKLEDIHSIDYDNLIEQAVENKNYRYAVRLNYLRTLKYLTDNGLIKWKPDKTNHDYLTEVKNPSLRTVFENLTSDFELVWYGELSVSSAGYSVLVEKYRDFRSLLEINH